MENKPLTERERIDALVFRLGISIRQLAKIVDMNENTFYHITDNSRFGISERTASKICYNLEKKMNVVVNRQWLLTGEIERIAVCRRRGGYGDDGRRGGGGVWHRLEGKIPCAFGKVHQFAG